MHGELGILNCFGSLDECWMLTQNIGIDEGIQLAHQVCHSEIEATSAPLQCAQGMVCIEVLVLGGCQGTLQTSQCFCYISDLLPGQKEKSRASPLRGLTIAPPP